MKIFIFGEIVCKLKFYVIVKKWEVGVIRE